MERDFKKFEIYNETKQIWMLVYALFKGSSAKLGYLKKTLKQGAFDLLLQGNTHQPAIYSAQDDDGYYVMELKEKQTKGKGKKIFLRSKVFGELQQLKNKLDESRKDTKHLGRPISYVPNNQTRSSPLSSDNRKQQNYRGLLNLAVILLVVTQFRAALENILEFGFFFVTDTSSPPNQLTLRNSKPALFTHAAMALPVLFSFFIQKAMAPVRAVPRVAIWALVFLNQVALVGMPIWVVLANDTHPVVALSLLFVASVLCLKTLSYHHVWHDVRFYVREERKYRQNQPKQQDSPRKRRKLSWGAEEWFEGLSEDSEQEAKPAGPKLPRKANYFGLTKQLFERAVPEYPRNISLSSYTYFLLAPTLCFQLAYPRTQSIRWGFIIKRSIELAVSTILMIFLVQQSVLPIAHTAMASWNEKRYLDAGEKVLRLQMQYVGVWILMFYSFFHCYLNIAGELLRFGDREFYRDWWNSTSLQQYWKEWNIPVHAWALRHIYYPMRRRGIAPMIGNVTVFFVSAVFHELIVAFSFKMYYFLAFMAMMGNVPLIVMQTMLKPWIKDSQVNNIFFWVLFCFIGHPVAIMLYHWGYLAQPSS